MALSAFSGAHSGVREDSKVIGQNWTSLRAADSLDGRWVTGKAIPGDRDFIF